jgi:hypothetical protein
MLDTAVSHLLTLRAPQCPVQLATNFTCTLGIMLSVLLAEHLDQGAGALSAFWCTASRYYAHEDIRLRRGQLADTEGLPVGSGCEVAHTACGAASSVHGVLVLGADLGHRFAEAELVRCGLFFLEGGNEVGRDVVGDVPCRSYGAQGREVEANFTGGHFVQVMEERVWKRRSDTTREDTVCWRFDHVPVWGERRILAWKQRDSELACTAWSHLIVLTPLFDYLLEFQL